MAAREEELEAELERERDSYLRELVSTLEEIESLVLDLSGANGDAEQTRSLARQIHTIKGTAGSLGLDLLSLAAHRMEDLLASERPGQDGDDKFIDRLLAQNDLLTSIAEAYLDDNARFLDDLRCQVVSGDAAPRADAKLEAHLDRVLIVEPSVATLQFCVKVLQELGSPQVTSVRDGYEALGLLLKEKFDAVITSLQIPTIDGQSLTAVLRTIPGPNAATPVVLLTSAAGALDPAKARPDYVVEKNLGLVNELSAVLQRLARRASGASSELKARALRKILLIDDSREIHALVKLSFKRFPEVQIVSLLDPRQAIEYARNEIPDLILLDVQMTPISGQEVMRDIKAAPELREIPVAFFTGTDDEKEKQKLASLGAWEIFQKPFSPKTFSDRVVLRFQER